MATTGLHFWSTTAATNATADSAVNWAEGQAPSSVNDSARALMASAAKTYKDLAGTITTGGTSTAYTITTNQVFASASDMSGAILTFIPHTTSGASPTLAVDGLTARQIRSATSTNVATGALIAGTPYTVTYIHASTEFILHQGLGVFGALTVSSLTSSGAVLPSANDAAALGASGTAWADLFLASGGVINWNAGNYTLTHSAGALAASGTFSATSITASAALSGATAAGSMIASQAEQETGSATDKVVTPGRQHFHPSAAKAWVTFNNAGTIAASYNVTSVTRNSAGNYTITIANDFSSAAYAITTAVQHSTISAQSQILSQAAGSFVLNCYRPDTFAQLDVEVAHVVCFGDI